VWSAAEEVYPGTHFHDYCLLGDDIMICEKKVALVYQRIIAGLGVKISLEKSLISTHKGAGEFCKWVNNIPLSLIRYLWIINSLYHTHSEFQFTSNGRMVMW